jgi:uncharacterized protein
MALKINNLIQFYTNFKLLVKLISIVSFVSCTPVVTMENAADLENSAEEVEIASFNTKTYKPNTYNIRHAAKHGNTVRVEFLLKLGCYDVNEPNKKEGRTPLHLACFNGHLDTTKKLLEYGAHINAEDCDGNTALDLAKKSNRAAITELLIDKGGISNKQEINQKRLLRKVSEGLQNNLEKIMLYLPKK